MTQAPPALSNRELNDVTVYVLYAVFASSRPLPEDAREPAAAEAEEFLEQAATKGVTTRGSYDVSGYRADADLLLWWSGPNVDDLQETYARFRRTTLGRALSPVWSSVGVHRPAEFNKSTIPAFVRGETPERYLCVYPFVRSEEWYLMDPQQRRGMLVEHGIMGREFPAVRANTVAAFGLGDYEWLLAFEAPELHLIVDMVRRLRDSTARRHVKVETPFYSGVRKPLAEIVAGLP